MNHERLADLLKCPICGSDIEYRSRVFSYCCHGKVLHTFRVKGHIPDFVKDDDEKQQEKVDHAFNRIAGRKYDKIVTGATSFDRFKLRLMWGTTKYIPLLFEMMESVTSDCEPGLFLDIPVGTGVFTAGEYSLQTSFEFIAADYNMEMLTSAEIKVRAADYGNVMLVRADVTNLPFVNSAFSGILTMNGLGAFPDKSKAMDELTRVLKPGGKLAGALYVRRERLLTDLVFSRPAIWRGRLVKPIYTEKKLLEELEKREIENIVTRKVKSIMFFSGRKKPDGNSILVGNSLPAPD
ncbi:MAG: class I SAM-dependent methyltransferase [Actinobacteria bacterium]|nr:class I SAM-dependent methyltransferase [Actinomycetota bacterium]